ncbi:MAG: aminoglycoside phosphotransferase [Nocardioides sp.]|nr:aminoglycoside phosphotransferase [Nocardioides sp.]
MLVLRYGVGVDDAHGTGQALTGGNASAGVVRVGDTVRKPWLPSTERTVAYLLALRDRGIDVPEPQGRDDAGRFVLEYVPGTMAIDRDPLDAELLRRIGALVRAIHDASVGLPVPDDWGVLIPAERADLLCHNDLASWNLVIGDERLVFIDWDAAGPSTRLWDLAYAAISFGHLFPPDEPDAAAGRLAAFIDGYAPDDTLRTALPTAMARRARAMHRLLRRSHERGEEPWASMYLNGHGEHWDQAADYVAEHDRAWRKAIDR